MTRKAAIFDLDGTILDTIGDLCDSINEVLTQEGLPTHSLDAVKTMVGSGAAKLVERALPQQKRTAEFMARVLSIYRIEYSKRQLVKTKPFPGIPELLSEMADKGWRLAVLSNKEHNNAKTVVEHFFPNRFNYILGVSPQRPPKPDLTGAKEALKSLGIAPESVFYFGDTDVDIKTAINCGCRPIGVAWGFKAAQELSKAGALHILQQPKDFFPYLENLEGKKDGTPS
ncbi:MAG: HAD family hydrolase [Deltaproteobacteria bacterium]|nr:HAD family hydrolase [Deltaproteobacteria bacterium]